MYACVLDAPLLLLQHYGAPGTLIPSLLIFDADGADNSVLCTYRSPARAFIAGLMFFIIRLLNTLLPSSSSLLSLLVAVAFIFLPTCIMLGLQTL